MQHKRLKRILYVMHYSENTPFYQEILWSVEGICYLAIIMSKRTIHIVSLVSALLVCIQAEGQSFNGIGLFNSFKGIGIEADFDGSRGNFNSLKLYADIYGLPSGRVFRPGVKLCYSSDYILKSWERQYCDIHFHLGPGVMLGYVKDFNTANRPGAVFGLTGNFGWYFNFKRKVNIDLSWTLEAGMHLRHEQDGNRLNIYKNGIYRFPFPQLTIIRTF